MSLSVFLSDEQSPFNFYNFDEIYPQIVQIITEQESGKSYSILPSPQANQWEIMETFNSMVSNNNDISVIKCSFNGSYCIYMINHIGSFYIVPFSPNKYFGIDKFFEEDVFNSDYEDSDDGNPLITRQPVIVHNKWFSFNYRKLIKKIKSFF